VSVGDLPKVFISYSHKDKTPLGHLREHLAGHEELGRLTVWDDGKIGVGDDWFDEIERELNSCAVAILLISAGFTGSKFCSQKEVPVLLERRQREGILIVPIFVKHCSLKQQSWLKAMQMRPGLQTAMEALTPAKRNKAYAGIVDEIDDFLESDKAKAAIPTEFPEVDQAKTTEGDDDGRKTGFQPKANAEWPALAEGAVDIKRLPTSGMDVVGRDDEFELLDDALEDGKLNVVSLRAWGGVGKSTPASVNRRW